MTFFYNLNKKLDAIRDLPSTTHSQLNEGVVSELKKSTVASYAKKAAADAVDQTQRADGEHEYGDPRIGQKHDEKAARRVAGVGKAVDRLTKKDMDESAFQAAIGKKKYGEEGMKALQKAGRDNASAKTMSNIRNKYDKYDEGVEEGLGDMARKVGGAVKKVASKALDTLGHGSDEDLIRGMQKKAGLPQTGKKPMAHPKEGAAPMSAKQKSFAALAEPKDKITFADKIAGAKKEVDEMLGDVAAEAMKQALGGGKKVMADEASQDNAFTAHKRPRVEKPAVGTITRGSKHDVEEIPGGRRVTRRVDPSGISVGADDDKPTDGEKRGRGRPKGPAKAPERVTGGATKHKGGRKTNEGENESDEIKQAMAMLKKAGYTVEKAAEQVDEKAVSKKQQRFMGMVHATQKGEKAPSKEVAKVAKGMGKKDAEDFAATKHKGLPEKKKSEGKKEKTEETADSTPSKGGIKFGGGIYDSFNRDLENMIKESMARLDESMSINMSMNNDEHGGPSKSLTVTATDEDAMKLSELLKSAGLGGGDSEGYGGAGYKSACGCGQPDCSCGDDELDEVDMNKPDYPTDSETSSDPFQYSGGLNKPKATGQTTVPVIASQEERQESYAEAEEDAIKRMMEMAGIAEAKGKKPDFLDVDKDGDKEESFKKAVNDKKEKKVDESIFAATADLWKTYKG